MNYIPALRRFWWLLVVGLAVALLAAIWSTYRVSAGVPPELTKRDGESYSAAARILVTSSEEPYFRMSITKTLRTTVRDESGGYTTAPVLTSGAPDTHTLVQAANLFPVLIQSDQVAAVRRRLIGDVPGTITARAIYSVAGPNRFELSEVPVIEIFGVSGTAAGAIRITQGTVDAFQTSMRNDQDRAKVPEADRIVIEQIQRPVAAIPSGSSSSAKPMLLAVLLLAAFAVLAVVADRMYPPGPSRGLALARDEGEVEQSVTIASR